MPSVHLLVQLTQPDNYGNYQSELSESGEMSFSIVRIMKALQFISVAIIPNERWWKYL